MPSPAEIPQRDEALKSLVARFQAAPGSRAFVELAEALLARGHASEALRIAEHGLQLIPDDVEGRVERAAALLALGRPRVAYVELQRALALHPHHTRGMRLLGKAFRDAGAPGRAAALLAQRSQAASEDSASIEALPADPPEPATWKERPAITGDADATDDSVPALFSALTKDLGLGGAVPSRVPPRRVEVTQIIRRKALPRPPRSASELATIEGPIVDTTQPGKVEEAELADEPVATEREPAPLWGDRTPGLADFALDDEPLFQENMPFAIRPVAGDTKTPATGIDPIPAPRPEVDEVGDTVVDEIETSPRPIEALPTPSEVAPLDAPSTSDLDLPPLREAPPERNTDRSMPAPPPPAPPPAPRLSRSPPPQPTPRRAAPTAPMSRRPDPRAPTGLLEPPGVTEAGPAAPERPFEPAGALIEKSKAKDPGLQLEAPPAPPARIALTVGAVAAMLLYVAALVWFGGDRLAAWWTDPEPKGRAADVAPVVGDEARARRAP